ncbi:hypothetical protein [uncultured Amnibacterium sp.]|uniref:hypothetical protein n=1 Tax=uncultured Amnibacterium sp. TaxID=1631851 RepID=UPI0035C9A7A1
MNPTRIWTVGAVVAVVAIFGAAAGLGIQPHLAAAAASDASDQAAAAQNLQTNTEIARLTRVAATQSTLETTRTDLDWAVPPSFRINSFSKMLRDAAAVNGVTITDFAPSSPTVYAPVAEATAVAPAATGSSASASATPTPAATPAPAPTTDPKSPWFGVNDPAITAANFTVVPVTVTVEGPASGVVAFATDAQQQRRVFAVTTVSTQLDKTTGVTTGVIAGYIYTLAK